MARPRNIRGEGGRLRVDLLAAARKILRDTGSEAALSVRGVTREAGAAPQSFYLHFRRLDDLIAALYAEEFDRFHEALVAAVSGADRADARLRALCEAYLEYAVAHPGSYRLLFDTEGASHDWPDGLPGAETLGLVTRLVADGGAADAELTSAVLWSALHGMATLRRAKQSFPWPAQDRLVDELLTRLFADVVAVRGA